MHARIKRVAAVLVAVGSLLAPAVAEPQVSTSTKVQLLGLSLGALEPAVLYTVDPSTGHATEPRQTGLRWITGIAFDPQGRLFTITTYDGNPPNSLIRIDPMTGQTTVIGSTGLSSVYEGDLAFDPNSGQLYMLYDTHPASNMYRVDTATGAATLVTTFPPGTAADISGIAFDPSGSLYLIEDERDQILRVDPQTGAVLSTTPLSQPLGYSLGLTYDGQRERFLIADGHQDGTNSLWTIDLATGQMTLIGPLQVPEGLAGLAYAPR